MIDVVDSRTRSRMMAAIRGSNTRPERVLRSALHRRGIRYRLHGAGLPGRPDLVLPRHRTVIFVHGCFWHRHEGCRFTTTPSTRPEFWQVKFRENVERDRRTEARLAADGWRIAVVWECALSPAHTAGTADTLIEWLRAEEPPSRLEIGLPP